MGDVEETVLPGVGIRYEFSTVDSERIGVLVHLSGRRELFTPLPDDPDAFDTVAHLDPDDARTLADLMGAPHIAERFDDLQQQVEGLAIDWLRLKDSSPLAGRSLKESAIHTETGVSIVAVIRSGVAVPAPAAEFVLESGDLVVAVGTPEGVAEVNELVRGSEHHS